MTPATGGNFYDAALLVGQTYTDSTYGISVTVNSATASALSVTVSMGGNGRDDDHAGELGQSVDGGRQRDLYRHGDRQRADGQRRLHGRRHDAQRLRRSGATHRQREHEERHLQHGEPRRGHPQHRRHLRW